MCACPWCGVAQDRFGYHALTCKKTGLKVLRHNALREACLRHCELGGIEAEREAPGLIPGSSERPADVLLRASPALLKLKIPDFSGSQSVCLDFAVTHTLQTNYINRASVEAGAAAAGYEETVKDEKYLEECKKNGLKFVPMVMEVYGVWGQRASPVLKFIARAVANRKNLDEELATSYLHRGPPTPQCPCSSPPQESGRTDSGWTLASVVHDTLLMLHYLHSYIYFFY